MAEDVRPIDNEMAEQSFTGIGAWILGRNMFGPVRGPWPDDSWKGWWGDEPPYHKPVFVLTHHPRWSRRGLQPVAAMFASEAAFPPSANTSAPV